jgi:WD40 repeat protein
MQFKWAIEKSPLQAYTSALVFSPARSLIRRLFKEEEPKWITTKQAVEDNWNACLQTLEGHSSIVSSVAFSHDSTRLASASYDCTVKIWDAGSGACLQTLKGYSSTVWSVAFSHGSTRLASASYDRTVKIWDAGNVACLQTLKGHNGTVWSVAFSHDSTRLASASHDCTVKIWDAGSGAYLQTLEGHSSGVRSVAFSHGSTRLASASYDHTVKIWDAGSGACLQRLEIGECLVNISFDLTGSYLHTNIGVIVLGASSSSSSNLTSVADPRSPQCYGWALGSDGEWITYNSENWVWLPSEHRPSCSAVSGKVIAVGTGSRKVWMCSFKVDI